jgi:hypothetical protein
MAERKTGSSLSEMLGEATGLVSASDSALDIISFTEAPWGLGMGSVKGVPALLPAQKFILKAFYGLPLDGKNKTVPINDMFNERLVYKFTEEEFLNYLYEEGRISTKDLRGQQTTLVLVCGRRGTKTSVTSIISDYESYKVLLRYHPQGYFGVFPEDIISMTCLSTSEDNAKIMYDRITGNMERSPFFKDFMNKGPNQMECQLHSTRDATEFKGNQKKYTLEIKADACVAGGLRGPNNILVVLDEVAHFFKEISGKSTSNKSDYAIYDAVTPSLAMFKNKDGTPAGKIILISSPADKTGLLYDENQRAFDPERGQDVLSIQLPSWEMNPLIASSYLRGKYNQNPQMYMVEFGAQFSDRVSGWIDDPSVVKRCIDTNWRLVNKSTKRIPYFLGGDVGLKGDASAFAVVHLETPEKDESDLPVIVLDWYEEWFAKDEITPVNEEIPCYKPEDVIEKIDSICGRFNIHQGILDQYYKMSITPLLEKKGLTQIKCREFNDELNSNVYQNLMAKMISRGIRFPSTGERTEKGDEKYIDLIDEMLKLQALKKSKYKIKVFMPEGKDKHDDKSDAFARAVFLACEYLEKEGASAVSGGALKSKIATMTALNRTRARMDSLRAIQRPTPAMIYKLNGMRYGQGGSGRFI